MDKPRIKRDLDSTLSIALFLVGLVATSLEISLSVYNTEAVGPVSSFQIFAVFAVIFVITAVPINAIAFGPQMSFASKYYINAVFLMVITIFLMIPTIRFLDKHFLTLCAAARCLPGFLTACSRDYGVTASFDEQLIRLSSQNPDSSLDFNYAVRTIAILKLTALVVECFAIICAVAATVVSFKNLFYNRRQNSMSDSPGETRPLQPKDFYTVKENDDEYKIRQRFDLTEAELRRLNPGKEPLSSIFPGWVFLVNPDSEPDEYIEGNYTIQEHGETAWGIAVEKFQMHIEDLKKLNPDVDPSSLTQNQVLRVATSKTLAHLLDSPTGQSIARVKYHTMVQREGEPSNGWEIAKKYGISQDKLAELNPGKKPLSSIFPGWVFLVDPESEPDEYIEGNYTIQEHGETAWGIAVEKFQMHIEDLKKLNPDVDPSSLTQNQVLRVATSKTLAHLLDSPTGQSIARVKYHTMVQREGEPSNGWEIAKKYGISQDKLAELNPGKKPLSSIFPGWVFLVDPESEPDEYIEGNYTIQEHGETAWGIAVEKFQMHIEDLKKLNPGVDLSSLTKNQVLHVATSPNNANLLDKEVYEKVNHMLID